MFETLVDDITQAFIQGGKGAVSFKSVLQGLQTQVVGLVAKLAIVNPVLNSLGGEHRQTLGDVSDSLAAGGSVGNVNIPGAGSAGSGVSTSGSWLSKASNTKLFGGATVGNLLAGVGGGFAIGSALGNLGGGTYGTIGAGAGAAIGAGIGSFVPVIGTLYGGLIGGGLGGLLGGLFGHKKNPYTIDQVVMEGDRFSMGQSWNQKQDDTITAQLKADMASLNSTMASLGLKAENLYLGTVRDDPNNKDPSQRSVSLADLLGKVKLRSDDSATFSQALSQGMPEAFDSVAAFQSAVTQLKAMAEMVDALGVAVSKFNSDGTVTVSGFTEATGDLRTALDTMLNGKTVATSDLQSQVATITEFVTNTMPNLMKATVNGQQSWVDQMEALKKTYEAAATQASGYGLDGNALNDKFSTLYEQGYAQNMQSLAESAQAFRVRYLTATGDDQGAALTGFDLSATQQKRQLADSWRDFLGEAYAGNATYLQQASDLEKTLGAERLAIQKQYADKAADAAKQAADAAAAQTKQDAEAAKQAHDQAASSAASVIGSLVDFTRGLSTSSASPLSAEAQYRAANDNFQSTLAAARAGDFDALTRVQGDAQTVLSTGQAVYGSGIGYTQIYEQVGAAMREIGTRSPEALTQAALNQTRDNTASLVDLQRQLVEAAEANRALLRETVNALKQSVAEQRQAALRKAS